MHLLFTSDYLNAATPFDNLEAMPIRVAMCRCPCKDRINEADLARREIRMEMPVFTPVLQQPMGLFRNVSHRINAT
jgi:hypothetical protein